MKNILWIALLAISFHSCKNSESTVNQRDGNIAMEEKDPMMNRGSISDRDDRMNPNIEVIPISHATFVMKWGDQVLYFDPTGGAEAFENMAPATMVLVTDIHGDHMNEESLNAVVQENTRFIAPMAVKEKLSSNFNPQVLDNGNSSLINGIMVTAIPMYNITPGRLDKHPKGRGNGYVLEKDGYRVYVSGDTEGIPEMRDLVNIDKAFVCMNLPYTMDIDQAADAVLDFAPQEVIPYHYRGTDGLSDVSMFKTLVTNGNEDIEVTLMDWYPSRN